MLLEETTFILQNFTSHTILAERSDLDSSVDKGEGCKCTVCVQARVCECVCMWVCVRVY